MKNKIAKAAYFFLSSPRLALAVLVYAVLLVFVGTLAQREIGIEQAQALYFESFFGIGSLWGVKFPFLGGAAVGAAAAVNIIFSALRFGKSGSLGLGVSIAHMSIVLLIISGALQYFLRVEGQIVLKPSVPTDTVELKNRSAGATLKLPFTVTLEKFGAEKWANSDIAKGYFSDLLFSRAGKSSRARASMNSPASHSGWTFYQMSYTGGGSSVLSAVKNPARLLPWLAVGSTFAGMMIIFLPRVFGKGRRQ